MKLKPTLLNKFGVFNEFSAKFYDNGVMVITDKMTKGVVKLTRDDLYKLIKFVNGNKEWLEITCHLEEWLNSHVSK